MNAGSVPTVHIIIAHLPEKCKRHALYRQNPRRVQLCRSAGDNLCRDYCICSSAASLTQMQKSSIACASSVTEG